MKFKETLKKVWHFIWDDNSIWSWVVNIILAFVVIKYILFPLMGFFLGSAFPVVAVVSSSMEHDGSFDQWWASNAFCDKDLCSQEEYYSSYGINKENFLSFDFKNGFNKGDIMFLVSSKNIEVGDVVVFFAKDGKPIIHRVINLDPLETKGDHNEAQITNPVLNEKNVSYEEVIGKAAFKIPFLGYIKIFFVWIMSLFGIQVA